MKKLPVLLFSIFVSCFVFAGYAWAQEGADPTTEEPDAYESDEDPVAPIPVEDEMMMFSDEATQEVGSQEAEYGDTEDEEDADIGSDEMVTTYDEDDNGFETDECTLWSCALYKMIVAVVGIGASAFWIFMLADIIKLDPGLFPADRAYRKWLWFAGVFFFWGIGAAVYYFEIFRRKDQLAKGGAS